MNCVHKPGDKVGNGLAVVAEGLAEAFGKLDGKLEAAEIKVDELRRDLKVAEQQVGVLRKALEEIMNYGSGGERVSPDAAVAARALRATRDLRQSEPQEERTKVAEQQFDAIRKALGDARDRIHSDICSNTCVRECRAIRDIHKTHETYETDGLTEAVRKAVDAGATSFSRKGYGILVPPTKGVAPDDGKVAEQQIFDLVRAFDRALDHLRTRECEHSGDYESCQREIEATLESHRTHDLRPPAPQSPRVTCPAVEGDMACQEDLGHPVPHRYCAGKGQPVYTWPIR